MTILANGRVVTPTGIVEAGWVKVVDDLIGAVGFDSTDKQVDVDLNGRTLIPGFVDQHSHGGGGYSFITTDPDDARRAANLHAQHGTTSIVASLVSSSHPSLLEQIAVLSPLVDEGVLVGIHLEGPWISKARCGAHDVGQLRDPQPAEVDELLARGGGRIIMVTIAPELNGALPAIRKIVGAGALAAIGHSDADYETTVAAINAGATVATHVTNAARPLHHRDPGVTGALLADPRVNLELIADGTHVHEVVLRLIAQQAGIERISLITDAMAAAGGADGRYLLGGLGVDVVAGVARLVDGGAIAGSTLTMDVALRFMTRTVGLPLAEVVAMLSTNPARVLGLADRGAIEVGKRADLVILGPDLEVDAVMRSGQWVTGGQ
ncbi:MAG: N-acetylglucosamine-6-phosphate deacetylase [Candidatus Nanopelagicales bacterium]